MQNGKKVYSYRFPDSDAAIRFMRIVGQHSEQVQNPYGLNGKKDTSRVLIRKSDSTVFDLNLLAKLEDAAERVGGVREF